MASALAPVIDPAIVQRVLLEGDLKHLTSAQKLSYYTRVCESVGLNPLTQPFQYIVLNGKEVLYARRECTEQLRRLHAVSIQIVARELVDDVYVVTARATLPDGRCDENIGAVPLGGLKGEARANAMMKAETKSKRRVTLSICGLGMLDETEVSSLPPQVAAPVEIPATFVEEVPPALEASELPPVPRHDDLPPNAVRIERVRPRETKNPQVTKYFVTLSSGEDVQTINQRLAKLAEAVCEAREPVVVTFKSTRWGNELVQIKRLETNDQEPERQVTSDDIPF